MTITSILDKIEAVEQDVDELSHIPDDVRNSIRMMIEDVQDALEDALIEYGDEQLDNDPYGDSEDDIGE